MTADSTSSVPRPCEMGFVGNSSAMQAVRSLIRAVATTDMPVFLTGESGTGKNHAAQAIHRLSGRPEAAFSVLNCAAVPDDILDRELFGIADLGTGPAYRSVPRYVSVAEGGTLFLDDICRASAQFQARLLHLLTSNVFVDGGGGMRPLSCRIIAATNADPIEMIGRGAMRRDLYDLLAFAPIHLPALRARDDDAAQIAEWVLSGMPGNGHAPLTLPDDLRNAISAHRWPGNIRQLKNVIQRLILTATPETGLPHDLPDDVRVDSGLSGNHAQPVAQQRPRTFAEIEREAILTAIAQNNGSVQRAARELDLAASTIYRKLKAWEDGNG